MLTIDAKPYPFAFPPRHTALLIIDMQRDFLLPNGFGEIQAGSLEAVQASIAPTKKLLDAFRQANLPVFHTREGHKPDLSDCPSNKLIRQKGFPGNAQDLKVIGDEGEMGRLLVRGEIGHDFVDELQAIPGEVVVDKAGRGAFFNTNLMDRLKAKAITHLIICGVTTECCFDTTFREANDRGFECCGIKDATAGYKEGFKTSVLDMIHWSEGLFGFVASLQPLLNTLESFTRLSAPVGDNASAHPLPNFDGDLSIPSLQKAYRRGLSPVDVIETVFDRIKKYKEVDPAVWIHLETEASALKRARKLLCDWSDRSRLPPLYGVPFSVKDSFDVAGLPTTTACPPLAHVPLKSALAYDLLFEQGAIFIGKTNLDQLATGLTGCMSPFGIPRSVLHRDYISGGCSSGSCVSVGAGLVTFSLGTDTAGSGRLPAGFNAVVGYKPTRGLISAQGVTPACPSLDCVAIIAGNVADARTVWDLCADYDEEDPYAKTTAPIQRHINSTGSQAMTFDFGIPPPEALAICNQAYRRKFDETVQSLYAMGGRLRPTDWTPFEKAGNLLYEGSFLSEGLASLPDDWLEKNRDDLHPVIAEILDKAITRQSTAIQAYRDLQAKARYTREAEKIFAYDASGIDVLVVPTAPTHWTVEEVLADPIARSNVLGKFTLFGNVLDLCAVAVPAGTCPVSELQEKPDAEGVLPFSVTFLGGCRMDGETLEIARRFEEHISQPV